MAGSRHFTSGTYADCTDINAMDGASTLSIAFWFYRPSSGTIVSVEKNVTAGSSSTNDTIVFLFSNNTWYVGVNCASGYGQLTGYTATGWHHVCMTFDGSLSQTSRVKFYIDGVLQTLTGTRSHGATTAASSGYFSIGIERFNGVYNSTGVLMTDVLVFSQCLNESQVQQVMHRPFNPPYTPIGHWPMTGNEAAGEPDIVGGYDGTYTGTKGYSALSPNRSIGGFH